MSATHSPEVTMFKKAQQTEKSRQRDAQHRLVLALLTAEERYQLDALAARFEMTRADMLDTCQLTADALHGTLGSTVATCITSGYAQYCQADIAARYAATWAGDAGLTLEGRQAAGQAEPGAYSTV